MRLFVAIIPPDEVVEDLTDFLRPRRDAGAELRWTDPEHLHLTLAFLPEVGEAGMDRLTEALTERCAAIPAAAMRLSGGSAFPNPYAARVLFAAAEPEPWLGKVARAARNAAGHAGVVVDGGRFHPHVTVARLRRPTEATRWIRILQEYESPGWVAESACLVQSRLGQGRQGRPLYGVLAEFPFAPAS